LLKNAERTSLSTKTGTDRRLKVYETRKKFLDLISLGGEIELSDIFRETKHIKRIEAVDEPGAFSSATALVENDKEASRVPR